MTQGKLIAMWAVAMVILAAVYLYSSREPVSAPGTLGSGPASTTANAPEPALPKLGDMMLPISGTWISPDGKDPELKGKVVLLDFWGITCPPCRAAIPSNNLLYEKYAPKGFVIAGLTIDRKVELDDYKKSVDIRYPLLATPPAVFQAYGIEFMPTTLLYDRSGKLVWKGELYEFQSKAPTKDFEKALSVALAAPLSLNTNAPANLAKQGFNDDAIPVDPEFAKLLAKKPAVEEPDEIGLKIGAAMPELKGEWIAAGSAAPNFKNNVLLIDFFTTVCGSCIESIPDNNAILDEFNFKGLVLAAATPEPKKLVEDFNANFKSKMRYPVLTSCNALFEICEVKELPVALLFGRDGKLVWKGGELRKNGKLDESFAKALETALNK